MQTDTSNTQVGSPLILHNTLAERKQSGTCVGFAYQSSKQCDP